MNSGLLSADKSIYGDERYTPFYAVEPLLKFLDKEKIIWCPFDDDWSAFVKLFKENGFNVVNSSLSKGQNFFDFEPSNWDILISNPPFSKKDRILDRIIGFNKPYALLLPIDTFQAQQYFNFLSNNLQILLFDQRIEYFQYPDFENTKSGISFGSAYFCKDFLPRDIVTERLRKYKRSLLSDEEAKSFNIILGGDNTLDMFADY